jgi:hypothetical protein
MKRDQADRRTGSRGKATRSTATARWLGVWPVGARLSAAPPAQALVLAVTQDKTMAYVENGFPVFGVTA